MTRFWRILLLSIAFVWIPCRLPASDFCGVMVRVTDNYGHHVPADVVRLTDGGTAIDLQQDKMSSVKCGRYTLNVTVPGFGPERKLVDIDQTKQVLRVAMRLGAMEASVPGCNLRAHLASSLSADQVRLIQLFGSYAVAVSVNDSGVAEFRHLECGAYMMIVTSASRCVGTSVLTISGDTKSADLDVNVQSADSRACTSLRP